jgi:hypothetical protein
MINIVFDSSTAALFRHFTDEQIICLNDDLSVGKLLSDSRFQEIRKIISDTPDSFIEERNEFMNEIKKFDPDEDIIIWSSLSPYELNGFYFTASLLKGIRDEVKAVILMKDYACAKMIPSKAEYEQLKNTAVCLNTNELSRKWTDLCEENSVLRVSENGMLLSANADYYDSWLEKYSGDPLCISKAVNGILEEKHQLVSALYLKWRLDCIHNS